MKMTGNISILKASSAIALAVALLVSSVGAQASAPTVVTRPVPKTEIRKYWSLPITVEYSSTMHAAGTYESQAMTALSLAPSYQISKEIRASMATTVYKEQTGVGNSGWDNTLMALSYSKGITKETSWFGTLGGILPTNQQLRDETSYQGAARVGGGLLFTNLFLDSSFRYVMNITRNFHEFNITADEGFNVRETLVQSAEFTLPFNDQWSVQTVFSYTMGKTYKDDLRTKFYAGADLNWSVQKNLIITAGTSNEGNALKPNGSDSNISFYDDTSSIVKLGVTYIL